jgi:hypothetical protein
MAVKILIYRKVSEDNLNIVGEFKLSMQSLPSITFKETT